MREADGYLLSNLLPADNLIKTVGSLVISVGYSQWAGFTFTSPYRPRHIP